MHPCIKDLCIKFSYGARHPIAKVFSDEFKTMIPENAIALATTCVSYFSVIPFINLLCIVLDLSLSG